MSSSDIQPDSLFLVQHYVDGADLQKRLRNGQSFTTAQVADIVRQTLDILTYLHELHPSVVHRDINPRNLILGDEGRIYLVDFGAIQQKLRDATVRGSTSVGSLGLMTGHLPSEWPIDDDTSKIRLAGLAPDEQDTAERRGLLTALDQMLEPLVARRVSSARDAIEVMESDMAAPDAGDADWKGYLFYTALLGGLGLGSVIYVLFFDELSETELVQISWIWLLPSVFGLFGLAFRRSKRPILYALAAMAVGAVGLACFFGDHVVEPLTQ